MKMTKKIMSLAIVFAMVMAMSVSVFAAADGTITINNTVVGETYNVYKIFDLISYSGDNYAYQVNEAWEAFIEDEAIAGVYVNVDVNGTVTWVDGADAQAFAQAAQAWAEENEVEAVKSAVAQATSIEFTGLELGYYLVDTTLGSLCSLDTADNDAIVNEKNIAPTMIKAIVGDNDGHVEANIGDTIEYMIVFTTGYGVDRDVTITDTMEDGLTYNKDIAIKVGGTAVDPANYTLTWDENDFTLVLKKAYLNAFTNVTPIMITYSADLNTNATTGTNTNDNTATMQYSEQAPFVTTCTVATYEFDIVKTDADAKQIEGAEFKLYTDAACTTEYALFLDAKMNAYRPAAEGETAATVVAGKATIKGLEDGTYYLKETKAPDGYNLLVNAVPVELDENNNATVTDGTYVEGGIQVVNQTGTELPSTGGIGTTIFYALGGLMAVGAGVLLVAKKRMEA